MALTAAWGLAYVIFQLVACWTQIRENFNNGDCPWIYGPGYVYVAVDVFVDTAILIIPMALVSNHDPYPDLLIPAQTDDE